MTTITTKEAQRIMPKVHLAETVIFEGRFLGPGAVEVSDEQAESLRQRGLADTGRTAADMLTPPPTATGKTPDSLIQAVGEQIGMQLKLHGLIDLEQVQSASDEAFANIFGIGHARIEQIRDAVGREVARRASVANQGVSR